MTERQRPLGAVSECLHCGVEFVQRNASHVFHSAACRHAGEVAPHERVRVDLHGLNETLSDLDDERVIVGMAMAAGRDPERVARAVIDRDDTVTVAIRAAGGDLAAFKQLVAVLDRHDAQRWQFDLLDLVTEVGQQDRERRGEPGRL